MANLYNIPATCSSSSSPQETTDDISLFLPQILYKSSSSTSYSSPSIAAKQMQREIQPLKQIYSSALSVPDGIPDEHDCESEGFENLMEEMAAKSDPPRNPSKRTRAAEDHNLSEKRRRSRINEKMKALQKLIPNSNKSDKASMLDEAIEYLKQLQLRVQMLTMRNGVNLYTMCVPPEVLQSHQLLHSRISLNEPENMTSLNQETLVNPMLSRPVHRADWNLPSNHGFSHIIHSGSSSSFRECLISTSGIEKAHRMNSQH